MLRAGGLCSCPIMCRKRATSSLMVRSSRDQSAPMDWAGWWPMRRRRQGFIAKSLKNLSSRCPCSETPCRTERSTEASLFFERARHPRCSGFGFGIGGVQPVSIKKLLGLIKINRRFNPPATLKNRNRISRFWGDDDGSTV